MASRMKRTAQRAALLELGAAVAEEMKAGQGVDGTRTVADVLAMMPQATLEVMALIEKETRKRRPDAYLVAALAYMAGQALELLRYGVERADPTAEATLGEARQRLVAHARSDRADPTVLMLLAKQFAAAKLDIGETLRDAMGRLIAAEAEDVDDAGGGDLDMERHLAELGEELGDDPFAIHTELAETASSFPTEHRLAMANFMLGSVSGAVRQAALGWLFDPEPQARVAVAEMLGEQARAGRLDPATLRRLVAGRNWLPAGERDKVDDGVRAARRKGTEPEPLPATKVLEAVASAFDGSGAGSVFVLVKTGRRHAVVSLLFKLGTGLRDAWVQRDLGKAEGRDLLDRVAGEIDVVDVSMDYVGRALRHFLGLQVAAGALPPFGALGAIEMLGLGSANPQVLSVDDVVAEALAADPERDGDDEILAGSAAWFDHHGFMESWFEDDAAVDAALKGRKGLSRIRKVDLVLEAVVAPQRRRWAELLAWTALVTAEADDGKEEAAAFAVVAREMLSDRPAGEIPLLRDIAEATVEARRMRRQ